MRYTVALLATFLTFVSCTASQPKTAPTPGEYVPFSITNNRPEQVTVTIGTQRERFNGMESRVVFVPVTRFSEGCATVVLQTVARDQWTSPRLCGNRKINITINANLALSQATVAP